MKEVRAEQHTMNHKYYHSDIKLILVDSFGFGFVSLKKNFGLFGAFLSDCTCFLLLFLIWLLILSHTLVN